MNNNVNIQIFKLILCLNSLTNNIETSNPIISKTQLNFLIFLTDY